MIDFLELSVPVVVPRGPFWNEPDFKLPKRLWNGPYELAQDLTPNLPVRILWDHRFRHDRKLQFLEVASLDPEAIVTTVAQVFDTDPLDLGLLRVDFAVDLPIPLQWFAENLKVARKRKKAGWGAGTSQSRWQGNSLYWGKHPSLFRVYDKAEQLRSMKRVLSTDTLTRIEHQAHGSTLKRMGLSTLRDLFQRAPELDPFAAVHLPRQATLSDTTTRIPLKTKLAAIGLQKKLETMSRAQLEMQYKGMGYRNAGRDLDKVLPFIDTKVIEIPKLRDLYSASVGRQLFGAVEEPLAA